MPAERERQSGERVQDNSISKCEWTKNETTLQCKCRSEFYV